MKKFLFNIILNIIIFVFCLILALGWHWLNPNIPYWTCCGVLSLAFFAGDKATSMTDEFFSKDD
jgi:hypothetical protein